MMQYVNRYFGACNPEKNEVVLKFFQEAPIADLTSKSEPGVQKLQIQNIAVEEVSSLVMSRDCAQNLVNMIQELLDHDEQQKSN